ncbi:SUN domain-containing protein 1-like isoform X1 [Acipenser ruthenus]|uniref:SUN domain-containing protein 1-like isoform X1 n=2 Tax=Acipenser ruthenus TaxID=7906 RepID=UPI00145AED13|nr:SUN domain-containing protein 1-like isoform X1 [Acipenser ruthenus]XP_033908382.1 SUN domain-containing protein 1-like isoform X1 [Acipenser ruthenus]XP_058851771.1 SUN domain-containing protein 1-like isoform X1 [Acipenser ruthenus]
MTMDYSRLHTYTPPQCVPENTGYTYSLSSSYSSTALDFENKHKLHPVFESPKMSRRSLRLTTGHYSDDSYLDTNNSSISYSGKYKESRSRKQNRSTSKQSALLSQPRPRNTASNSSLTHTSFHSCASDLSLMSTMLQESSIQERTVIGSFWGLDEDGDLKDATVMMANGDITTAETQTTVINGYTCNECTMLSDRKDALTAYCTSNTSSTAVYSRDKSKKSSIFHLFREQFLRTSKHAVAFIASLIMQLIQNVLLKIGSEEKAHSSFCGSMNVKDLMMGDGHLGLNGSLCDDCKGKKHLQTQQVHLQSSRLNRAARTLWHILSYTGYYLLQAVRTVAPAGWLVTRKVLSVLWLAIVSPGKAASGALWWLGTGWYQLITLMSLLNVFVLTRCLPKLYKLLLLLIPFLLLLGYFLGLWYFGPASWLSLLPVLSRSEMQASLEDTTSSTPVEESVATGNMQPSTESPRHASQSGAHFFDSGRMVDLERQLALLSDRCDRSSQQYDERHGRVVELFHQLQEQVAQMSNNEGMSTWISNLFNQHMSSTRELRGEGTGQPQNEFLMLHQGHESRILELEKLLQIIAAKTEEQKHKYTEATTFGGQSEGQSYLLSEVKRLELELHQIKTDLLRVQSSPPGCEGLASVRETVDTQVKESVKLLIFGNKDEEMSESLLQWLSTQFVRQSDLQGLLMEMEMKILKNITMYKSKTKLMPTAEVVTHAVHNAGAAGMTEEQVRVIVTNALRLYSQDQTGLVDYALESGGGSILSTRCSETYETKTALMSLFGIPLWYFSQSPRVIIQPDVHPGNCWAFKGSQGYLVIRLSLSVYPTSFSLEHIPKSLSPTGSINSAPKDFTVYGLEDEYQEEGKLLGRYIYNEDGDSLQTFPIQEENDKAYQIIEMRVLSNWGHPEYTCLYRFRVHGEPRLE